jgi:hypothetical protein
MSEMPADQGMNAPGVNTPGANAPGVNTPGVNTPGVNAPGGPAARRGVGEERHLESGFQAIGQTHIQKSLQHKRDY